MCRWLPPRPAPGMIPVHFPYIREFRPSRRCAPASTRPAVFPPLYGEPHAGRPRLYPWPGAGTRTTKNSDTNSEYSVGSAISEHRAQPFRSPTCNAPVLPLARPPAPSNIGSSVRSGRCPSAGRRCPGDKRARDSLTPDRRVSPTLRPAWSCDRSPGGVRSYFGRGRNMI
jgi:hypothetical protein